ncbi:hypothetical protein PK28_14890 [Hymenobacter sp. DG25B]|nr:hypothetical protein PK28_14890 [Hymenobacter sp. DG25B]
MKQYGLVCLLLFCGLPGFGQGRDTVFAVHKLFAQKRGSGAGWVATGAEVAYDESVGWRAIGSKSEKATAAIVHGGVPTVVGTWQMLRFSAEREAAVIKGYQEGWSIPADIRSRLRRKHFRLTARDLSRL